jgi:hypothetical protein
MRSLCALACVLLVVACVVIQCRRKQAEEKKRSEPFGRFTAAQITDRTQPLFHLIVPERQTCWMALTQNSGIRADGSPAHFWVVDCLKDNSQHPAPLAHFQWDADTGQLLIASNTGSTPGAEGKSRLLSAPRAAVHSWHWLRTLGLACESSRWRLVREPHLDVGRWDLLWRGSEGRVHMVLDAASGALQSAKYSPARPQARDSGR